MSFGAEFVGMKRWLETLKGIHYELCRMGISIDGDTHIYRDSMSVMENTSKPESVQKKKKSKTTKKKKKKKKKNANIITQYESL